MSTELELEALFRAEQAAAPAASALNHGWQRLSLDLAANVAPLHVSTGALKLATWLVPKWLLLGFTVGLVGAGVSAPLLSAPAPTQMKGSASPPATALGVSTQTKLLASSETDATPAIPVARNDTHVLRAAPLASAISSVASNATFDAELKLISFAKGELDAHRPRQARAWLAEHAERFPSGVFAVEREAIGILCDCQQGPKNAALASAFSKRHPGSPLTERLERACRPSVDFSNSLNGAARRGEPMTEPSRGDER